MFPTIVATYLPTHRYLNDSTGPKIVCRGGNETLTPTSRWGVVLFQTVAFITQETVKSGRRGLLAVLGSVGGAYSIIFTFAALAYKFMWVIRARNGWTGRVRGVGDVESLQSGFNGSFVAPTGTGSGTTGVACGGDAPAGLRGGSPPWGSSSEPPHSQHGHWWTRARNSIFGISPGHEPNAHGATSAQIQSPVLEGPGPGSSTASRLVSPGLGLYNRWTSCFDVGSHEDSESVSNRPARTYNYTAICRSKLLRLRPRLRRKSSVVSQRAQAELPQLRTGGSQVGSTLGNIQVAANCVGPTPRTHKPDQASNICFVAVSRRASSST